MPERLRFHIDGSADAAIAVALRRHGIDVTTTQDANLVGATDEEQLRYATTYGRAIVTYDADFLRLARQGAEHAGILYCYQRNRAIGRISRRLIQLARTRSPEAMRGHIEFISRRPEGSGRVR